MAKLSCDICGNDLIFERDLDTLKCEVCGVKYSKEAIKTKLSSSSDNKRISAVTVVSKNDSMNDSSISDYSYLKDKVVQKKASNLKNVINSYYEEKETMINETIKSIRNIIKLSVEKYYNNETGFCQIKNGFFNFYLISNRHRIIFYNDKRAYSNSNYSFTCKIIHDEYNYYIIFIPNKDCLVDFVQSVNLRLKKDGIKLGYDIYDDYSGRLTFRAKLKNL